MFKKEVVELYEAFSRLGKIKYEKSPSFQWFYGVSKNVNILKNEFNEITSAGKFRVEMENEQRKLGLELCEKDEKGKPKVTIDGGFELFELGSNAEEYNRRVEVLNEKYKPQVEGFEKFLKTESTTNSLYSISSREIPSPCGEYAGAFQNILSTIFQAIKYEEPLSEAKK